MPSHHTPKDQQSQQMMLRNATLDFATLPSDLDLVVEDAYQLILAEKVLANGAQLLSVLTRNAQDEWYMPGVFVTWPSLHDYGKYASLRGKELIGVLAWIPQPTD